MHTFHFLVSERMVTLEDMALQFGVRVDGQPVTGSISFSREMVENLCQRLLGVRLEEGDI